MATESIASEDITPRDGIDFGSILTNKYCEGQPNAQNYGGNEIDNNYKKWTKKALELDEKEWGVNAQPRSESSTNFAVHTTSSHLTCV